MIHLDIPGLGPIELRFLVCDYSGTLSVDGVLVPGIERYLSMASQLLDVHIITADTHGKARDQLAKVNATVHILEGDLHDAVKVDYITSLGAEYCIALGNGNNDIGMLRAARIGVMVLLEEGCSSAAMQSADIVVRSAADAIDLVLNPNRLKATLRC
ncbi:MAG: ATPase P [candidate division Zixibacteria bacterium]|nr:ATPase P [candidate division Zixibacteria bacterium]